ncbi:MAG: hypothetical protein Q8P67_26070 [archaeon]|nr:hypothetical protein [archaeon]
MRIAKNDAAHVGALHHIGCASLCAPCTSRPTGISWKTGFG